VSDRRNTPRNGPNNKPHRLHPSSDHHLPLPRLDVLRREHNSLHSRRADLPVTDGAISSRSSSRSRSFPNASGRTDLVHRCRLGRLWASSTDDDLPRGRLSHTGLEHVAEVEILDLLRLDTTLGEHALDRGNSELDGGSLGKDALVRGGDV
jgi:hypothetical protein